jgi:ActR/RegA family two-component response regulator
MPRRSTKLKPKPGRPSPEVSAALKRAGASKLRELQLSFVVEQAIRRAVHSAGGSITLAARLLGLHRRSLQRHMRRFGFRSPRR